MNIVTLTLNPAFDLHCHAASFVVGRENLAQITSSDAGGKGVNISRALLACGHESTALVVLGDENGEAFAKALESGGLSYRSIKVKGRIRENITIHTDNGETRLSFLGFAAQNELLDRVFESVDSSLCGDTVVTFTGRVPDGIDAEAIKGFLKKIISHGAKLVIDSRSLSLSDIIEIKPWLIKPNGEEISEYLGREITRFADAKAAAEELHEKGVENVMISLGESGAMLVSADGTFVAAPPKITPLSTIGAGDSTIAGFIAASRSGERSFDCLAHGVACGTAACLTAGTNPPLPEDIKAMRQRVTIKSI